MGIAATLGDLRLVLKPIGFGAFKIGRNEGAKYPQRYQIPEEKTVERLLNEVLDAGINYIDTAPAYGLSEERIGTSICHRRNDFVLSTKVGEAFTKGRSSFDFNSDTVRTSIERSLRNLRTDYLDILFIHAPHEDLKVLTESDIVGDLQKARDKGQVLHIGFSGYSAEAFGHALDWADAIMVEYNVDVRQHEPIIEAAAQKGVAVVVKKGLGSGRLNPNEAIPFVLINRGVTSLVVGGLNLRHVKDNLRIANDVRADHGNFS